jgi:diaminopimelate decarboxylase
MLEEIAGAVGTPFYAYDGDLLRERIGRLDAALDGVAHLVCYSAKANDALALLRIAADSGLGVDIVSGGELFKALRAGVPGERIVFSGVGKRRDEIRAALDVGVRSINVESPGELDVVAQEARAVGRPAPVSVRLNPDVATKTHAYISTGQATSKFGLPADAVLRELRRAATDPALEPVGVSFHVGSQLLDHAPVLIAAERAAAIWRELSTEGIPLRDLDAGGGLGIPYDGGDEVELGDYAGSLVSLARELAATLIVEPGRYLVGPAGRFVTRVLYVKEVPGRRIAVCDGGMNDFLRPSLYSAQHPIAILGAEQRPIELVDVVGPVCESGDVLAQSRELPVPEPGDLVVIEGAGAYGRVMASTYNSRPLCAEVLIEDGGWRVIREAGAYGDLVRGEITWLQAPSA